MVLSHTFGKLLTTRPPQTMDQGSIGAGFMAFGGNTLDVTRGNPAAQMETYAAVSWIFAVVNRIASSTAATEWHLYRGQGDDRVLVESHPAIDGWMKPNPFYTQEHFTEASQQHIDLTGESYWLVVRNMAGAPVELWPVRPDRITPIPSARNFINGYRYKIGSHEELLEASDVIPLLMPDPRNPYRGLGPVQSLMVDIGAEDAAAEWMRNFFRNSAEPGGVIEVAKKMSDDQFDKFVSRWRATHQGVSNAHRVAVLEEAVWKDRKMTQRDMQFTELRMMNRDLILGAFGFPKALLGITDDVNRANAEAGEVMFARWVVRPRLRRIRAALNHHYLKLFPNAGDLHFDFVDPVPDDREAALAEAERGYTAGFVTRNEARARLGLPDTTDGGDDFRASDAPADVQESPDESRGMNGYRRKQDAPVDPADLFSEEQANHEIRMWRTWRQALREEADLLAETMEAFVDPAPEVVANGFTGILAKVESGDFDAYDWDGWMERHGDRVEADLARAFEVTMNAADVAELEATAPGELQRLAATYARNRTSAILAPDGLQSLPRFTRRLISSQVASAIRRGAALGEVQRVIRDSYGFSSSRAETIARTESANALGWGKRALALERGDNEKRWVTQGDDHVDIGGAGQPCLANERQDWIKVTSAFGSGHETVPAHPRCRCTVEYRTADPPELETPESSGQDEVDVEEGLQEDVDAAIEEAGNANRGVAGIRCPECKRRQPVEDIQGRVQIVCVRCKHVFTVQRATVPNMP